MFKILFNKKVKKQFSKLGKNEQKEILSYLTKKSLLNNPYSKGRIMRWSKKGFWRYRVSKNRIICKINPQEFTILITEIGHRNFIYKK